MDRLTLPQRLADEIEVEIEKGRWRNEIPGYRILAENFGVSWKTSRAAQTILEQREVIHPVERGKPRRIRESFPKRTGSSLVLLAITSSEIAQDVAELELLDEILMTVLNQGGRIHRARVDFFRHKRPTTLLQKLIRNYHADVIVLREPSYAWVDAARKLSFPVYFMGGAIPISERSTVSGFAVSITEMIEESVKRLRDLGHQRILIPDEGMGKTIRSALLSGIRAGFGDTIEPPPPEMCCPVFTFVDPKVWLDYWEKAFDQFDPTAVIVRKETSYHSLLGFCYRRGLQIPKDLSVVCHSASENLRWCFPQPDRTTFPKRKAVALFRKWIERSYPVSGIQILSAGLVEAGSVKHI